MSSSPPIPSFIDSLESSSEYFSDYSSERSSECPPEYLSDYPSEHLSSERLSSERRSKRDYHLFLDDTCHLPREITDQPRNEPSDDTLLSTSPIARAIFAGIIAFIYIAVFVWLADRFGPVWAAIFGSIPGTLIAAVFFTEEKEVPSLVFGLILGFIAGLIAGIVFYLLITTSDLNKFTIFILSGIVWVILIALLFTVFRSKIERKTTTR